MCTIIMYKGEKTPQKSESTIIIVKSENLKHSKTWYLFETKHFEVIMKITSQIANFKMPHISTVNWHVVKI
jgi:hypothetical protein